MASVNKDQPDTLLLAVTKDGTMKIGLPPYHYEDSYGARSTVIGKLGNVRHVICSPEGELFCVRDGDLYRGPLPSKNEIDWFSLSTKVGKWEWSKFKILFFHPNGELYGTTKDGDFYKGPQPDNENLPWMYGQAKMIGNGGWQQFEVLFFDPSGVLFGVTTKDKLVKPNPPASANDHWIGTSTVVGAGDWGKFCHFISFSPDGKLWCIDKKKGNIYSGIIPEDGKYINNAKCLGYGYNQFPFLSFTIDKTISSIVSFDFLPEQGKKISEINEVLEEEICDNRKSTSVLKHNFTFDKTVKTSTSFTHEHDFAFEWNNEIKLKAGMPCIAQGEVTIQLNLSTRSTWTYGTFNENEVKFSSSSEVEVQPGKAIRVVASVVKAEMSVPYRARVRTLFGSNKEISGTWHGASMYNLKVTQEDYEE